MESLLPASLALTAAALWGLCNHIQRKALDDTDALTGAFLSVGIVALVGWVFAPFYVDWGWWSRPGTLVFMAMGVFFPALGQRFQIASVQAVGPALTASIASFTPVIAVSIGMVFLGEVPDQWIFVGLAMMVAGLILSTYSPRGMKRGWPVWALVLPLGAACVRGISQPGVKHGLQDVPSPLFALLVTASMSTLVLGAMLWRHHAAGRTRAGTGVRWFLVNGLVNGAGILALNMALSRGTLALVSPLAATVPLWALVLGAFVFRRETLTWKHLWVALLIVLGGALILSR